MLSAGSQPQANGRPDDEALPTRDGSTTAAPSDPPAVPRISTDAAGPSSHGLLASHAASSRSQADFLPSLAPVSPLSSSPYFSQGFATFPSMSDDLSAASPLSTATAASPLRAQPPPRLNLPPLHLNSFKQQLSPDEHASLTQLSYRRTPSPASPLISPGVASPTKAGRAVVVDAPADHRPTNGELLSPVTTPKPDGSFGSSESAPPSSSSPVSAGRQPSAAQPPLPLSATSDQFPLDPASRASSSSHSAADQQRPLNRKDTVGLSLVKASNEARSASPGGGPKEVMRGLGFVEAAHEEEAATSIAGGPAATTDADVPDTATSGTFGPPPPAPARRVSASSHPSSPPPAPSPSGPPPPVPTLPQKSTQRAASAASPAGSRPTPQFSAREDRPSTATSVKSSVSSQSSGPASSRKGGPSSAGVGGLSAVPPLPMPPPLASLPRSDSGVLDPRLLNGSLVESSPPQEVLQDAAPDGAPPPPGEPDGPVNFAGIGSRHLFSPLQSDPIEAVSPATGRTSIYDSPPALGPTPSQRRALPHPPKPPALPSHAPPPQPQQRGSYPPLAQVASPPTVSKRLVDPAVRYPSGQSGPAGDDPYQAARRSMDPQAFQGMVGQVGQTAMGPEVCLECMMRDRDLMHVDVNSPGVWARQSDVDLHDLALREVHGEDVTPRLAGGLSWEGGGPIGMGKVPGLKPSSQRSIAGDRLTEAALKEWTLKSPPAATHRFQTLRLYLIGQMQLINELAGGPISPLAASSEVENRILKSKIQNTFAPLRRDEHVTLTPTDAARMRPGKVRAGPDRDSTVDVENYNGKMSFDRERSRRKSVGLELHNKQSRLSMADGGIGALPQQPREFPSQAPYGQQGVRSTTMPMALPSSASAINFPHQRQALPQDDGGFRSASAASFNNLPLPRGESLPMPDGKPVRPFSFAMWAGRTRSSSNASQDASRGGIFKGRFGMGSGRSEASDMTGGGGGSAWGGSGSMMNMHVALDRDQEKQNRLSYASPYQQNASSDALNQRWRNDGGNMSYAASSQFYPYQYPGSAPTSPGRQAAPSAEGAGKKKKGFKAFFSKLGGGSVKSSSSFGNSPQLANGQFATRTPSQGYPSPGPSGYEEFAPLAPPPSLKFLSRGKTPSTSSLQSLSSGPNSPRGPPPPGADRSRAGSLSGSSVFSGGPPLVAPALSSGQSFSSSQHPRSVSTPIHVGPGGPHHGKAPSLSPSAAPSASSMSPSSGTFPVRRSSRDTLGSRQSLFAGADGPRPGPADGFAEESLASFGGEYFPPGDSHQRRSMASLGQGSPARFSPVPPAAHRLSVSSGPLPMVLPTHAAPPLPSPGDTTAHRRQSSNFQKELPPLPPPSPNLTAAAAYAHVPIQHGPGPNGRREPSGASSNGYDSSQTVRGDGTDKSKKEKRSRGKLSGFFGVGGGAKKDGFDAPPRSSSRNEGSLVGYRYSSHEAQ